MQLQQKRVPSQRECDGRRSELERSPWARTGNDDVHADKGEQNNILGIDVSVGKRGLIRGENAAARILDTDVDLHLLELMWSFNETRTLDYRFLGKFDVMHEVRRRNLLHLRWDLRRPAAAQICMVESIDAQRSIDPQRCISAYMLALALIVGRTNSCSRDSSISWLLRN